MVPPGCVCVPCVFVSACVLVRVLVCVFVRAWSVCCVCVWVWVSHVHTHVQSVLVGCSVSFVESNERLVYVLFVKIPWWPSGQPGCTFTSPKLNKHRVQCTVHTTHG